MSSRFTLDIEGYYGNKITFIIPDNNPYLLSTLNSRLIWFYLKKVCAVLGDAEAGGRLNLQTIYIETLPIRNITFTTPQQELDAQLEEAKRRYDIYLAQPPQEDLKSIMSDTLKLVKELLAKQPEQADVIHDLLAYLAEQMLELNKVKRAKQKEFLSELVRTLKVKKDKDGREGIDALVGKQQLAEYAGDYRKEGDKPLSSDDLVALLRKNRARLGVSLDSPMRVAENWTYKDEVRRLYKESLAEVLPVKERLRRTDALIDQVVYRLYGLTDDEIKIVEGEN
jgi:hypothetical protein